jgi:catechol 2,3-dioxygenase-like lactoylglutathione lyase family enzyme
LFPGRCATLALCERSRYLALVSGLHTIFLGARDLDRSAAFYVDVLGLSPVAVGPSAVGFQAGGLLIHVTAASKTGSWVNDDLQRGIRHFGIKVDDVDAEIDRLRAAGVRVIAPPADVLGGVRIAFFLDPDGARIEFVQGDLQYEHVYTEYTAGGSDVHVAVTVESLPDRWPVIGDLRHHDDPRGFLMTYFQAGPTVLEVFTFDVPTAPDPIPADPGDLLGFRGIGID